MSGNDGINIRFRVEPDELCELLDMYSLDEIQTMIQNNAFNRFIFTSIAPYLRERMRRENNGNPSQNK